MRTRHQLRGQFRTSPHDPSDRATSDTEFSESRRPRTRRGRMFDPGDIKLLILHILGTEPCHGYEIIHVIGEMVGNDYSPSPGTVYPTLALLEDLGLITVQAQEGGRKQYRITEPGRVHLQAQQTAVLALLEQLGKQRQHHRPRRAAEIERAMENLKTALRIRFADGDPEEETLHRIAEAIDRAALDIGRLK